MAEAVTLARRAAAIGKDDAIALWSSGMSLAYGAGAVETGVVLGDRATILNPNLAIAWSVSGWMRVYLGEPADAIERFERAMRLSPLDHLAHMSYAGMCFAHICAGQYDEAASWGRKGNARAAGLGDVAKGGGRRLFSVGQDGGRAGGDGPAAHD
jgi:hypothetical protein